MKTYTISRKMDGHLEYLIENSIRWTRDKAKAATFASFEEANEVRQDVAGPIPTKEYGTYPSIN